MDRKKDDDFYESLTNYSTNPTTPRYNGKIVELPHDQIDNEYINTGYRINCNTNWTIFCSLFKCHNETFNIWSHLLGKMACFSMFLFVLFYY